MELTHEQDLVARDLERFVADGRQLLTVHGVAGTGKTSLVAHVLGDRAAFGAPTAKAASVLRAKGVARAATLHSLMYAPTEVVECRFCAKNTRALRWCSDREREHERSDGGRLELGWSVRPGAALERVRLLVVDEASMVGDKLARDLRRFTDTKIVAVGDPFQLPPVKQNEGPFMRFVPDHRLTEIHRQAAGSNVLELAHFVRENQRQPRRGAYGESAVCGLAEARERAASDRESQRIVGMNGTRRAYNAAVRRGLPATPVVGDRLICRENNAELGIVNGEMFEVVEVPEAVGPAGRLDEVSPFKAYSLDQDGEPTWFTAWTAGLMNHHEAEDWIAQLGRERRQTAAVMYWSYAITAHNAQGSSFSSVVVKDESDVFKRDRWRWLYTALTRASERVTLVT